MNRKGANGIAGCVGRRGQDQHLAVAEAGDELAS